MSARMLAMVGAGFASAALMTGGAAAQGYGHGHKQHVCHVEVKTEAVYGTAKKAVIKQPGRWEVKEHAAVYGDVTRRFLVKAGEWEVKSTPAVFEDREKQVLVKPEHVTVHVTPPVWKIEKVEKKVVDGYGKEKIVFVDTRVLVKAAEKKVEKTPAVFETRTFKVLVKAAQHEKIFHQPVFETKTEKVIVKAAWQEKIFHKPIIEFVDQQVLVKPAHVFKKAVWKPHGEAC